MKFLEKDLEQIIFEADRLELFRRGLSIPMNKFKRQVRIGNYGIADLISFSKAYGDEIWDYELLTDVPDIKPFVTIVELKQECISLDAFMQAIRYAKGVRRYIEEKQYSNLRGSKIHICLIGSKVDLNGSFVFLPEILRGHRFELSLFTYDYKVDGITFKEHIGYQHSNEGFNL